MVSTDTVLQAARLYDCGANRNRIMTAATFVRTSAAATLQWENGTQWENFPELGSIYTQEYKVSNDDEGFYRVSFTVEDGRRTGLLFVDVESHDCDGYAHTTHYCLGQFHTNQGAIKFAQFAFEHFIETETWSVCPSFEPVDYIDGEPYTLRGEEIVSELWYS
jgi:hypothetical protein